MTDVLTRLEQRHPGLENYARAIGSYFGLEHEVMRKAYVRYLKPFDEEELARHARRWEELGVLPDLAIDRDEQVGAIWANPLFPLLALDFCPPPDVDLREHILPPVRHQEDLPSRLVFPEPNVRPYWQAALWRTFPELFLLPELKEPGRGLDIACGWGRASLSLRHDLEVHGCDLTESSLELLERLARNMGKQNVHTKVGDVTGLPYPENHFDFILAFDIYEHLTDPALHLLMSETLRVARDHAVLYTEIPVEMYHPPITHLQNFKLDELVDRFRNFQAHGKTFELVRFTPEVSDQFTFRVRSTAPDLANF